MNKKQKIGVDLDEVLAELSPKLLEYHNDIYGTGFSIDDCEDFRLAILWGCSRNECTRRVHDFYKSKYFKEVKPVKGSKEGIEYLANKYDLFVITSRPSWLEKETVEWVEKYFPNKFKDIILTNQVSIKEEMRTKSEVGKELGISYLIDDHVEYLMDSYDNGIKIIAFDMPWNRKTDLPDEVIRISNWSEIKKHL